MSKFSKVKVALQKLLMQFGEVATDKGNLEFAGEELVVGSEVFIDDIAAPDGDYETETQIIVVRDGQVIEINEKPAPTPEEAPEAPEVEVAAEEEAPIVEEPAPAEPSLEEALVEILAPITDAINALKADVEAMKARMSEIEEKLLADAAKPAEEEFKETSKKSGFYRN